MLQDVNSLRDFYEVNLELAMPGAPISFYEVEEGIISSGQVLPPALISGCEIEDALIGEGSVLRVSALRRPRTLGPLSLHEHWPRRQACSSVRFLQSGVSGPSYDTPSAAVRSH